MNLGLFKCFVVFRLFLSPSRLVCLAQLLNSSYLSLRKLFKLNHRWHFLFWPPPSRPAPFWSRLALNLRVDEQLLRVFQAGYGKDQRSQLWLHLGNLGCACCNGCAFFGDCIRCISCHMLWQFYTECVSIVEVQLPIAELWH